MRRRTNISHISLSAMMLALGFVLPFLTGQIPEIGNMFLPMHLPVFILAMISGPQCGAIVGFVLPLLRSLILGMPPLFPNAIAMSFELATYGLVSGLIYKLVKKQNIFTIYLSLLSAMIIGRGVWGLVDYILLSLNNTALTWQAFISGAF